MIEVVLRDGMRFFGTREIFGLRHTGRTVASSHELHTEHSAKRGEDEVEAELLARCNAHAGLLPWDV
jgi:hypothetical protein